MPAKKCRKGKACGKTCIKKAYTCTKNPQPLFAVDTMHVIKLSVNLISGFEVDTGACTAGSRISCADIENYIVPMINDIYNETGVLFAVKHCAITPAEDQLDNPYDASDLRKIEELFDLHPFHDSGSLNIFVVPLCSGGTLAYQLEARGGSFIVMGENHPITCAPMTRKNFAETLAHEIGHDLGVRRHHTEPTNLMYWADHPGTELTVRQRSTILETAKYKYPIRGRGRTRRRRTVTQVSRVNPILTIDRRS